MLIIGRNLNNQEMEQIHNKVKQLSPQVTLSYGFNGKNYYIRKYNNVEDEQFLIWEHNFPSREKNDYETKLKNELNAKAN
jgi:hypothetical protein